jgi:hypothetical protein
LCKAHAIDSASSEKPWVEKIGTRGERYQMLCMRRGL